MLDGSALGRQFNCVLFTIITLFSIMIQVPSALGFFTLACILFVNIHRKAQKITCGVYPGGPMFAPCTK